MNLKNLKHSPIKMPPLMEFTVYLICEELKSRKFFNTLRTMGMDNCDYQPHLNELILANVGLDDDANETFDFYYDLIEKHSERIEPDKEAITKEAFHVYLDLMIEKNRRQEKIKEIIAAQ